MNPKLRATRTVKREEGPSGQRSTFKPLKKNDSNDENDEDYKQPKPAIKSERQQIRLNITSTSQVKRESFMIEHKDYFLPLLPQNNYIKKLVAKDESKTQKPAVPMEILTEQPKGIKATMKPYQLTGLSFLVWLHRNGMSGILGDEMGLGKTLQTLSLCQYLKEKEPTNGQARPFLIICPLSVLNTWVTECKKWAPELKIVRFHGVRSERDRVKKIATGELDFYGNETLRHKRARKKIKKARDAKKYGYDSSDSDTKDEKDSDVGESEAEVDIIVTTYETFKSESSWFKTVYAWRYVVLDEGQIIKNEASLISKSLFSIRAEYRLILTGTPIQNNLNELWALFQWLCPEVFTSNTKTLFDESFNLTRGRLEASVLENSKRLLELIMRRKMKKDADVNLKLPEKTDVLLYIPLTPMQRFWYKRLITKAGDGLLDELFNKEKAKEESLIKADDEVEKAIKALADSKDGFNQDITQTQRAVIEQALKEEATDIARTQGKGAWMKLMNLMMQLRKVCSHPYLIHEPSQQGDYAEHLINASGKFIVLEKIVNKLVIEEGKKIVIFSGFTMMLDLVSDFLHQRGRDGSKFETARIDGSVSAARRNLAMRLFQDENSSTKVMLLSTRAGGLGITLTAAADMVFLDADWNPQVTVQAEARCHRIGQTKPVTVYKIVSQGTVEEQMLGRIQKKLYLATKVTESMRDIHSEAAVTKRKKRPGQAEEDMPNMSMAELMSMMKRGTSALARPQIDASEMVAWDWETTLAKCKDEPLDLSVKKDTAGGGEVNLQSTAQKEKEWFQMQEQVNTLVFEGKAMERGGKKKTGKKAMGLDFEEEFKFSRAERREGKNVTVAVMVDGMKVMVNEESMNCEWGEAIPTMSGKDPRLSEPKRAKKVPVENQSYCQCCMDGGHLILCEHCPRSYHMNCLSPQFKVAAKSPMGFICPQHECSGCQRKTANCGGMLYRCRWCENAHCEECLEWDNTNLLGDGLKEYRLLNYPFNNNAYYIECEHCICEHNTNKNWAKMIDMMAEDFDEEYVELIAKEEAAKEKEAAKSRELAGALPFAGVGMAAVASAPESLSDGMTVDTPGIATPPLGINGSPLRYGMGVPLARKSSSSNLKKTKRKASSAASTRSGEGKKKKVKVSVREIIDLDSDGEDVLDLIDKEARLSISY